MPPESPARWRRSPTGGAAKHPRHAQQDGGTGSVRSAKVARRSRTTRRSSLHRCGPRSRYAADVASQVAPVSDRSGEAPATCAAGWRDRLRPVRESRSTFSDDTEVVPPSMRSVVSLCRRSRQPGGAGLRPAERRSTRDIRSRMEGPAPSGSRKSLDVLGRHGGRPSIDAVRGLVMPPMSPARWRRSPTGAAKHPRHAQQDGGTGSVRSAKVARRSRTTRRSSLHRCGPWSRYAAGVAGPIGVSDRRHHDPIHSGGPRRVGGSRDGSSTYRFGAWLNCADPPSGMLSVRHEGPQRCFAT